MQLVINFLGNTICLISNCLVATPTMDPHQDYLLEIGTRLHSHAVALQFQLWYILRMRIRINAVWSLSSIRRKTLHSWRHERGVWLNPVVWHSNRASWLRHRNIPNPLVTAEMWLLIRLPVTQSCHCYGDKLVRRCLIVEWLLAGCGLLVSVVESNTPVFFLFLKSTLAVVVIKIVGSLPSLVGTSSRNVTVV